MLLALTEVIEFKQTLPNKNIKSASCLLRSTYMK
jgi:hypothetical protein